MKKNLHVPKKLKGGITIATLIGLFSWMGPCSAQAGLTQQTLSTLSSAEELKQKTNSFNVKKGEKTELKKPMSLFKAAATPEARAALNALMKQQLLANNVKPSNKTIKYKNIKNPLEAAATPAAKATFRGLLKHPFLTYTAKSVYTPAGVPIQWGGVGVALSGFNGYPVVPKSSNLWGGGVTVVLPIGDSDKIAGLALAVSEFGLQSNQADQGGSNGNFTLVGSRWLGRNTMVVAGAANLVPWGNSMSQLGKSYFGALTQMWGIDLNHSTHQMSGSVGLGSGIYAPLGQLTSANTPQANLDNKVYPLANLAFNFTPNFAIAGDYYSQTFALGLSYNKVIGIPLGFMVFVGNLNHTNEAPSNTYGLRISAGLPF